MESAKSHTRAANTTFARMLSALSDEELVHHTINYGRELYFERYLFPKDREELETLKRELLARLRRGNSRAESQ
jgi:hypothetical protein